MDYEKTKKVVRNKEGGKIKKMKYSYEKKVWIVNSPEKELTNIEIETVGDETVVG